MFVPYIVKDCVGEPDTDNAELMEAFGGYKNLEHGLRYKCQAGNRMKGQPWAFCQRNGSWHTLFTCCE